MIHRTTHRMIHRAMAATQGAATAAILLATIAIPMIAMVAAPAHAQTAATAETGAQADPKTGVRQLGFGMLIVNDSFGDTRDRWQSASVATSRVYGHAWTGQLPDRPGALVEVRFGGQIISPANLAKPGLDRLYAGALSLGAHTHYARQGWDIALGGDLVMTGPQTGLDEVQDNLHRALGLVGPDAATRAAQVADGLHPTLVVEMGRQFTLGAARLRPFVEGRAGAETLLRGGVDLMFGRAGGMAADDLMARDPVSGHRYRAVGGDSTGTGFVLGADIAHVSSSVFFPASSPVAMEDSRSRLRAGIGWQGDTAGGFYGLTWLSPEWQGQPEGQLVGAIRLNFRF